MITIKINKSKRCNGNYSLYVSFPYDIHIVDIIRNLPYRYWDSETKEWEIPSNKLNHLLGEFEDYRINILDESNILFGLDEKPERKAVNYSFKTKPFKHQIEGFNYGMENEKWLLGDDPGLGKTKQSIDIAVAKKQTYGYKHCLVICGVNGLKWNWREEVKIHSDESSHILGEKVKKGKWEDKITIGSNQDKLADLENLPEDYFIITNVESLRYKVETGNTIKKRGKACKEYKYPITDKLVELCNSGEIDMIVFDEFHKVKNSASDQGEQILRLKAKTMVALTGTPLMNSPLDLYIIFKWLGYENHSFYSFKNHYCQMGGYGGYQVVAYKNLDELQIRLNDIMLRRLKDDVLDLPEKTYIDEYVDMGASQTKLYKEVTSDIKVNIDKIKMSNNPLSEMIRLRQVTGYPGILSSEIVDSAKLDRMEELVEESIENHKKVIIFSNWTQITDEVYNRLSKNYKCLQITGQTKDDERQEIVNKFQENDNYNVIIGSTGAMGTGITLHAASVEIFMDEPWNRALKTQAEDRAHRIGQNKNLTIYSLLTKNTIDERIHNLIYKKGLMSDRIVDQIVMDKSMLVEYLLS